jgi:hypothetical protein
VDVSLTIQNNDYKMISEIKQDTSAWMNSKRIQINSWMK